MCGSFGKGSGLKSLQLTDCGDKKNWEKKILERKFFLGN
jgi:hypothetical protein